MQEIRETIETANRQDIVMLYDSAWQGKMKPEYFDPDYWQNTPGTEVLAKGRGTTYKIQLHSSDVAWVLRHYYRGGLLGRIIKQSYVFSGENKVRSIAEFRLTQKLYDMNLPVAKPVAAMYFRKGFIYKAAIITQFIPSTMTLSQLLQTTETINWQAIAEAIFKLHHSGLIHGDLNAHNILIDEHQTVTIIDLDKSSLYPGMVLTSQHRESLTRLRRSIDKVALRSPTDIEVNWNEFIEIYRNLSV